MMDCRVKPGNDEFTASGTRFDMPPHCGNEQPSSKAAGFCG
jgi:hypothetical protein